VLKALVFLSTTAVNSVAASAPLASWLEVKLQESWPAVHAVKPSGLQVEPARR